MNHEMTLIPPYDQVPKVRKEIEEIEILIENRLSILEILDQKLQKGKVINEIYNDTFSKESIDNMENLIGWKNKINEDVISHFFLCIAFCKNEMQKNWY